MPTKEIQAGRDMQDVDVNLQGILKPNLDIKTGILSRSQVSGYLCTDCRHGVVEELFKKGSFIHVNDGIVFSRVCNVKVVKPDGKRGYCDCKNPVPNKTHKITATDSGILK